MKTPFIAAHLGAFSQFDFWKNVELCSKENSAASRRMI